MKEFFLYEEPSGHKGVIRTREITQISEFTDDESILQIVMRDGRVIESKTYDLSGFASLILEDDIIEELLQKE